MIVNILFLIVFMAVSLLLSINIYYQSVDALWQIPTSNSSTIYMGFSLNPFGFSSSVKISSNKLTRKKRSLIELINMIYCTTRCDPFSYKGYGCYCGLFGSGNPVDEIDRCCAEHDACYENSSCYFPFHYIFVYDWRCVNGIPSCVESSVTCSNYLCNCDRNLANCLKRMSCPKRKPQCNLNRIW